MSFLATYVVDLEDAVGIMGVSESAEGNRCKGTSADHVLITEHDKAAKKLIFSGHLSRPTTTTIEHSLDPRGPVQPWLASINPAVSGFGYGERHRINGVRSRAQEQAATRPPPA